MPNLNDDVVAPIATPTPSKLSPTAASASNPLFGVSGVIPYAVQMQTAFGGLAKLIVEAATGDEAAVKALAQAPGSKIMHIEPAS